MSDAERAWMTPKEIEQKLGGRKTRGLQEDVLYNRRTRRELLDEVMAATGCNEYSAEDFLRDIVKS